MSEKRFIAIHGVKYHRIEDTEKGSVYYSEDAQSIDLLVDLLNEQQSTIKSKDKQLERLYNYFQYYLKDEMSSNAFSEMWDFVKEDEEWEDE